MADETANWGRIQAIFEEAAGRQGDSREASENELLGEFEETALRDAFLEAGRREVAGADYVEAILRGQAAEIRGEEQS